ncbi:MAG TPA: (d)CMP kinase [Chloroflexota bacterium]
MPPRTIAIDGPAGSGKSVIGLWLARELGYAYLDTGALYRAIAYLALEEGVDPRDGPRLAELAGRADLRIEPPAGRDDPTGYAVRLNGRDVTAELFTPAVNEAVSPVASQPEVRSALLPIQRRIAGQGRVVMAGRDIGTVVMPDAELKLYLDASLDERARRRWEQETAGGRGRRLAEVVADVRKRDRIDSERATAPLRPADDAVVLRTDGRPLEETKARVMALVQS